MDTHGYIKKQTFYLAIAASLLIGFLGGVVYSVYRAPSVEGAHQTAEQQKAAATALATLEKATRDKPNDGQNWVDLGHAYFDTGQAQKAIAAYLKALELLPGNLDVMTDLGVMYHQNGQEQKAIDTFDQVLQLNPQHEQARFNKGVVLLTGLNDHKRALEEWKILIKYHPMAATPGGKMVGDLIDQMEKENQPVKQKEQH